MNLIKIVSYHKIRFSSNFIDTFVLKKFKNISIEIQLLAPMLSVYRTQKKIMIHFSLFQLLYSFSNIRI